MHLQLIPNATDSFNLPRHNTVTPVSPQPSEGRKVCLVAADPLPPGLSFVYPSSKAGGLFTTDFTREFGASINEMILSKYLACNFKIVSWVSMVRCVAPSEEAKVRESARCSLPVDEWKTNDGRMRVPS